MIPSDLIWSLDVFCDLMEKTLFFIDGGYFSIISTYYKNGKYHKKISIIEFSNTICKELNLWCDKIYYYFAPPYQGNPPTKDEEIRKSNYDRFVHKMRKNGIIIREGRCQKKEDNGQMEFGQKGVDTLLTMDLFTEPKIKNVKTIVILTSDTDFVPILNTLRSQGIKVILCYYSDRQRRSRFSMSNHLFLACDKKIIITDDIMDKSKYSKK